MNNEKLKIDLCGRLPYGVKCETPFGVMELTEIQLTKKNFTYWFGYDHKINSKHFNASICRLKGLVSKGFASKEIKPLFFPISSLTKPIQLSDYNNGEPFVPIVELAKTSFGKSQEWITIKSNEKGFYCQNESYRFHFNHLTKSFYIVNYNEISPDFVANQSDLFDLLNRWKIDYRNLISEGLAIEVNSDNNPYL